MQKWTNYGPYLWSLNFIIILGYTECWILPIILIPTGINMGLKWWWDLWQLCAINFISRFLLHYEVEPVFSLFKSGLVWWFTLITRICWKWHWWHPSLTFDRPWSFGLHPIGVLRLPCSEKAQSNILEDEKLRREQRQPRQIPITAGYLSEAIFDSPVSQHSN